MHPSITVLRSLHLTSPCVPVCVCRLPAASLQRLEHIDLSGCERLTDRCVERLFSQLELHCAPPCAPSPPPPADADIEEAGGALPAADGDCYDCESHEECGAAVRRASLPRDKNGRLLVPAPGGCCGGGGCGGARCDVAGGGRARLTHLILSGCHRLTASAAWRLAGSPAVSSLRLLDVSGCWRLTGASLRALAAAAPRLDAESLWYCDQIGDGPHPDTANGCDNVECPIRHCCRNR